ncbi:trace amine-associated receptor 13c-like [Lepisosteus oculatus]|uniref:trace amine-associated receptor 13c-like n=1 Tax=Lepisosteus oculatus TaxID=7918 RepID=UPI0035F505CF
MDIFIYSLVMELNEIGERQIVQYCFSSDNTSCPKETRSTVVYVILYVFFISVVMLTVFGNLMVIISISHFKQLHTPTNLLLLSLAVADFLIGLFVMPFVMVRYIETCWYFGRTFCIIFYSVLCILTVVSLSNVVFISIDRYFAVCHPLRYSSKITVSIVCISIIFSWSFSIFYVAIVFGMNFKRSENLNTCLGDCLFEMSVPWVIIDMLISFILPCSVMIVLYIKIFIVAKRHAQVISSVTGQHYCRDGSNSKISKRSERKAAKTLGIIMGVYLLCWIPYYLFSLVVGNINFSSSSIVMNSLFFLVNFNSALNPILYAFFYPWFQQSAKEILTFRICDPATTLITLFPGNH